MNFRTFIITLLAFFFFSTSSGRVKNPQDTIKYFYFTYGLAVPEVVRDVDPVFARDIVARKWKFQYKQAAGDLVSTKQTDSIDRLNETVLKYLRTNFGHNWEQQFKREVEAEHKKMLKMAEWVEDDKIVKSKLDSLKKEYAFQSERKKNHYRYFFAFFPTGNEKIYRALVKGSSGRTILTLLVDYNSKKVKITDDTIKPSL